MQVGGIIHTQQKKLFLICKVLVHLIFPNLHKTFSSMYIHLQHIHHYTLNKLKMVILNLETENQNVVDLSTQQLVQFPSFSKDTFLYVFLFFFIPFFLSHCYMSYFFSFPFTLRMFINLRL